MFFPAQLPPLFIGGKLICEPCAEKQKSLVLLKLKSNQKKGARVALTDDYGSENIDSVSEPGYEVERVVLPQIASIRQTSELMGLPPYYLRRLCREVPGLAFQSGVKWYINLGRLAEYYNHKREE